MTFFADDFELAHQQLLTGEHANRVLSQLRAEGDNIIAQAIPTVVDKPLVPPSGDKHDYMSLGSYWWPNPDTANGLPYVRRDGERNPEGAALDSNRLRFLFASVRILALAWALSGEAHYAEHAVQMLHIWFIAEETAMTPHLEFAQGIPGVCAGRDIGIIDSGIVCHHLLDGLRILEDYSGWPKAERLEIRRWLQQFFNWLLTSDNGRGEAGQHNNHGTWYDVQVAALATYLNKIEVVRETAKSFKERIASQIQPDGSQPYELSRTLSQSYSTMNLEAMTLMAILAQPAGIDLWNYSTADGRSIQAAINWLLPFAVGGELWPYQQIQPFDQIRYLPLMRRAAQAYGDTQFKDAVAKLEYAEV